jgi:cell division protein FtsB
MSRLFQNAVEWLYRGRRKLATAAIGALLSLIGYHALFGANGFLVLHQKTTESHELQREIQALQQDNARREEQIRALKSNPQAIEKEAREHYNYARPGEKIYKLPAAMPTPANPK